MIETKPRIALLIDADNSQSAKIDEILTELASYGECSIRRAYGNWKKDALRGWEGVLHEKAIRPVQQFDYSRGKNASDMALVVDAMALLYTDRPEAFAIVSSDADFTPLVQHLKERGAAVYGFGQKKTPEPFVSACTRFLFVENLGDDDTDDSDEPGDSAAGSARAEKATPRQKLRTPTAKLKRDAKLVKLLRDSVHSAADDDGWALVGTVGNHISNQSSFDTRNYGYATLTKLLKATELFEMRDEGTGQVAVRDMRGGGRS